MIARAHLICAHLEGRNLKPCKLCPLWETEIVNGKKTKVQRFCRGMAEEVIRIVKTGGPFKSAKKNREYRARIARRASSAGDKHGE